MVLGSTPQTLFELTQRVYSGIDLTSLLPIESNFLWLNLGQPDPLYILPILVFVTMFAQTKFTSPTAAKKTDDNSKGKKGGKAEESDPTAAVTQSMQYTMPIMFGFFSLSFQSGLSIYFVLSNLIGMAQGLYTRRVMAAEKEALASQKELKSMGLNGDTAIPQAEIPKSKAIPSTTEKTNKAPQGSRNKNRKQSKRKRRSAKR